MAAVAVLVTQPEGLEGLEPLAAIAAARAAGGLSPRMRLEQVGAVLEPPVAMAAAAIPMAATAETGPQVA